MRHQHPRSLKRLQIGVRRRNFVRIFLSFLLQRLIPVTDVTVGLAKCRHPRYIRQKGHPSRRIFLHFSCRRRAQQILFQFQRQEMLNSVTISLIDTEFTVACSIIRTSVAQLYQFPKSRRQVRRVFASTPCLFVPEVRHTNRRGMTNEQHFCSFTTTICCRFPCFLAVVLAIVEVKSAVRVRLAFDGHALERFCRLLLLGRACRVRLCRIERTRCLGNQAHPPRAFERNKVLNKVSLFMKSTNLARQMQDLIIKRAFRTAPFVLRRRARHNAIERTGGHGPGGGGGGGSEVRVGGDGGGGGAGVGGGGGGGGGDESAVVSLQKNILPVKPRALRFPRSRANIKNSASVLLILYDPAHALKRDVAQTLWCVRAFRCW